MALEDKVNDKVSKGFIEKAFNLGFKSLLAAGATIFSIATTGSLGIIVGGALGSGVAIGNAIKKKPLYEIVNNSLRAYTAINAILSPMIWLGDVTMPLIPNENLTGKIARTAYAATAYNAAFVAGFKGAEHLYDNNLNPKGIVASIKDNFYNVWKRIGLVFLPAYALVANGIPDLNIFGYKAPVFAANAFPAGLYNSLNPIPTTKKSQPSYIPQPSPA